MNLDEWSIHSNVQIIFASFETSIENVSEIVEL